MFNSLKDLLPEALRRGGISKQVQTTLTIDVANRFLRDLLPPGREGDAQAMSIREGVLLVGCLNGPVSDFVAVHAKELQDAIIAEQPNSPIVRVQTRLVSSFHATMDGL